MNGNYSYTCLKYEEKPTHSLIQFSFLLRKNQAAIFAFDKTIIL